MCTHIYIYIYKSFVFLGTHSLLVASFLEIRGVDWEQPRCPHLRLEGQIGRSNHSAIIFAVYCVGMGEYGADTCHFTRRSVIPV